MRCSSLVLPAATLACTIGVVVVSDNVARAHPRLEASRAHLERGDFERAIEGFLRAADEADDFEMADVIELYVGLALAHMGLRDEQAMREAVRALAAIAPDHVLSGEIPPDIRDALEAAKRERDEPIRVEVYEVVVAGGLELRAQARNAPPSLVRMVGIRARAHHEPWRESWSGPLVFLGASRGEVEYEAMLVGPGGLVIARAHAEISVLPESQTRNTPIASPHAETNNPTDDSPRVWPWVVAAVVVLAAGGAGVGIWFATREDDTFQLSAPRLPQ